MTLDMVNSRGLHCILRTYGSFKRRKHTPNSLHIIASRAKDAAQPVPWHAEHGAEIKQIVGQPINVDDQHNLENEHQHQRERGGIVVEDVEVENTRLK